MKTSIFSFLAACLVLCSCNTTEEPGCQANDLLFTETLEITTSTEILNALVNGYRRYAWDLNQQGMSTTYGADVTSFIKLNQSALQIPVDIQVFIIIDGEIEDEIVVGQPDGNGYVIHHYNELHNLSQHFEGCEGSLTVRVQLSFQTTGQASFDDEYLSDILASDSELKIQFLIPL